MRNRLRTLLLMVLMSFIVVLVGCGDSDSAVKGETGSKVEPEPKEWTAEWVLYKDKQYKETGEGDSREILVEMMSDEQFTDACGYTVSEECIEMCKDLDDYRCTVVCLDQFTRYGPCADGLKELIEKEGVQKAMAEGYMSGWLILNAESMVEVGEVDASDWNPRIDDAFLRKVNKVSVEGSYRYMAMQHADVIGAALNDLGYEYDRDVETTYINYEEFMEAKWLVDFVVKTKDGNYYWFDFTVNESNPKHVRSFVHIAKVD